LEAKTTEESANLLKEAKTSAATFRANRHLPWYPTGSENAMEWDAYNILCLPDCNRARNHVD